MKDLNLDIKVSTVGEDDRPDLEGKIITYDPGTGKPVSAIVVGCNRSVGCTIVDANDKDHYHACVTGPCLPDHPVDWYDGHYDEFFDVLCIMIEQGEVRPMELLEIVGHTGQFGNPTADGCAYSR